jgi:hypothetical protein
VWRESGNTGDNGNYFNIFSENVKDRIKKKEVFQMSDSNNIVDDIAKLIGLVVLFAAVLILPFYAAYYFFRWCRYRTVKPFAIVAVLILATAVISQLVTADNYGSNFGLAMVAFDMLALGSFLLFSAWVLGQIYRVALGRDGRYRMEDLYRKPGYVSNAVGDHHLMAVSISPFPFIAFSLLGFKGIGGALSGLVTAFWYMSILFYIGVAILIIIMWVEDIF